MVWPLVLATLVVAQAPSPWNAIDVSALVVARPAVVAEIDTGKLKGEPRRLSWSPDGTRVYLQVVAGEPPAESVAHYAIDLEDGELTTLAAEPEWAAHYWRVKQDRVAPGLANLAIEVEQKVETVGGVAAAGVLDRTSNAGSIQGSGYTAAGLANAQASSQRLPVVRLSVLGELVAMWVNERPIPGTRFSWGPTGSGALVHVGDKGALVFVDQGKRHLIVAGTKDAVLPAWSLDGQHLAWFQRSAKKKFTLHYAWVSKG